MSCSCNFPAKRVQDKHGKEFLCCAETGRVKCNFFSYVDSFRAPSTLKQVSTTSMVSHNVSGAFVKCKLLRFDEENMKYWVELINPRHAQLDEWLRQKPEQQCRYIEGSRVWHMSFDLYDSMVRFAKSDAAGRMDVHDLNPYLLSAMKNFLRGLPKHDPFIEKPLVLSETIADYMLPFQREGVEFIIRRGSRGMIADEMGCGKTMQAITVMHYHKDIWPCLVITPLAVVVQWSKEVKKFLKGSIASNDVKIIENKTDIPCAGINIVSMSRIKTIVDAGVLASNMFRVVVCDESHHIKSKDTARYQYVAPFLKGADVALLLSGTPATNRPEELYAQLHATLPKCFPSYNPFVMRYCNAKQNHFGGLDAKGSSNMEELNAILMSAFMIRRSKAIALSQLPPKNREVKSVEVGGIFMTEIKRVLDERAALMGEAAKCHNHEQREVIKRQADVKTGEAYQLTGRAKVGPSLEVVHLVIKEQRLQRAREAKDHAENPSPDGKAGTTSVESADDEELSEDEDADEAEFGEEPIRKRPTAKKKPAAKAKALKEVAKEQSPMAEVVSPLEDDVVMAAEPKRERGRGKPLKKEQEPEVDIFSAMVTGQFEERNMMKKQPRRRTAVDDGSSDESIDGLIATLAKKGSSVLEDTPDASQASQASSVDIFAEDTRPRCTSRRRALTDLTIDNDEDSGEDIFAATPSTKYRKSSSGRDSGSRRSSARKRVKSIDDDTVVSLSVDASDDIFNPSAGSPSNARTKAKWGDLLDGSQDAEVLTRKRKRKKVAKNAPLRGKAHKAYGSKTIIFCHHKEVMDAVEDSLRDDYVSYVRIDGKTTQPQKVKKVEAFQEDNVTEVALLSIKTCGTGINLTRGAVAVFVELSWSPGDIMQAEDRIHRLGQLASEVRIVYVQAKHTADDFMWRAIENKIDVLEQALGDGRKQPVGQRGMVISNSSGTQGASQRDKGGAPGSPLREGNYHVVQSSGQKSPPKTQTQMSMKAFCRPDKGLASQNSASRGTAAAGHAYGHGPAQYSSSNEQSGRANSQSIYTSVNSSSVYGASVSAMPPSSSSSMHLQPPAHAPPAPGAPHAHPNIFKAINSASIYGAAAAPTVVTGPALTADVQRRIEENKRIAAEKRAAAQTRRQSSTSSSSSSLSSSASTPAPPNLVSDPLSDLSHGARKPYQPPARAASSPYGNGAAAPLPPPPPPPPPPAAAAAAAAAATVLQQQPYQGPSSKTLDPSVQARIEENRRKALEIQKARARASGGDVVQQAPAPAPAPAVMRYSSHRGLARSPGLVTTHTCNAPLREANK